MVTLLGNYPIRPSALVRGVEGTTAGQAMPPGPTPVAGNVVQIVVRVDGGVPSTFRGRVAQTLHRLAVVGNSGLSSIENVGPRLSHYIFVLRRAGVGIVTIDEKYGGASAGEHARYKLTVPVQIVEVETR